MSEKQAPSRLREYETIFLVKPELPDEGVERLKDRVREIVNREGGKLIRFTVWGKKRTMYPVAKQPRALYVHSLYLGGSNLVAEIERNLRNLDEVTRYLSVRVARDVDPESRPALEDVKLVGDVEDGKPPAPEREGFRPPEVGDEMIAEIDEETTEEA